MRHKEIGVCSHAVRQAMREFIANYFFMPIYSTTNAAFIVDLSLLFLHSLVNIWAKIYTDVRTIAI